MNVFNKQQGQTLIETAIILILILLILFGITEFARAWFTKNSLKNAVRHAARTAAVTPKTPFNPPLCQQIGCPGSLASYTYTCPNNSDDVITAFCTSPGTRSESALYYCYENKPSDINISLDFGDTIRVCGVKQFTFVIGGQRMVFLGIAIWPWPKTMNLITDASMRYEVT